MTTLQTLSSRSSPSAQVASERALLDTSRAGSAPTFNDVLESTLEDQLLSSDQADGVSGGSDSDYQIDQEQDSNESEANSEDSESNGVATESEASTASSVDSESSVAATDSSNEASDSIVASSRLNSTAELSGLLTHAASINLADIATNQLEGQVSKAAQSTVQAKTNQQAASSQLVQQPNVIVQQDSSPHQNTSNSLNLTQKPIQPTAFANSPIVDPNASTQHKATDTIVAQPHPATTTLPQQAHAQQTPSIDLGRHWQGTQQQIAQAAQTAVHHSASTRTAESRPQTEPAIQAIKGIDATSAKTNNSGAGQSGFDLGARPQSQASLTQSKTLDDGALQRQQVIAQVQRGLASVLKTSGGSMKIRLSPEHLGEINIQLMTSNGSVKVDIQAERSEVHAMLKDSVAHLRQSMEARGIQIDELNIQSPTRNDFDHLINQQATTDSRNDQQGSESQENHQQKSNEKNDPDSASQLESGSQDIETPRGIWTDLGLDAIA